MATRRKTWSEYPRFITATIQAFLGGETLMRWPAMEYRQAQSGVLYFARARARFVEEKLAEGELDEANIANDIVARPLFEPKDGRWYMEFTARGYEAEARKRLMTLALEKLSKEREKQEVYARAEAAVDRYAGSIPESLEQMTPEESARIQQMIDNAGKNQEQFLSAVSEKIKAKHLEADAARKRASRQRARDEISNADIDAAVKAEALPLAEGVRELYKEGKAIRDTEVAEGKKLCASGQHDYGIEDYCLRCRVPKEIIENR